MGSKFVLAGVAAGVLKLSNAQAVAWLVLGVIALLVAWMILSVVLISTDRQLRVRRSRTRSATSFTLEFPRRKPRG